MMSVRKSAWWEVFVQRLEREPLPGLASEFGMSEDELERALALADPGGAATEAPWWPEAVRRIATGGSIRDTARRFSTNPRRLRRGLARAGIRVGGTDIRAEGVAQLADFREKLGKVPDTEIAAEAGVPVEAVQGERRRLDIPAFRPRPEPRPRAEPTEPAEAAERRPERPRRSREGERPERKKSKPWQQRVEVPEPQVIRRPASVRSAPRNLPTARVPAADELPRFGSAEQGGRELRPVRIESNGAEDVNRAESSRRSERRRRIVRPDRPEDGDTPSPAEPRPIQARRRLSPHGEVRVMGADEVAPEEIEALVETHKPEPVRPARISLPRLPAPIRRPIERPQPAPGPALERLEPPPVEVDLSPADLARAEHISAEAVGWRVRIGGQVQPFVILAPDMHRALELLADRLNAEQLSRASVWRTGPLL